MIKKKELALKDYNQINALLAENESKLTNTELTFYIKAVRQKYNDIIILIDSKLPFAKDQISSIVTIGLIFLFYKKLKGK